MVITSRSEFKTCFSQIILLIILFFSHTLCIGQTSKNNNFLKSDTAFVPKEIEDPECIGIHKEVDHATLMPYGSLQEALAANRHASSFYRSLNGTWKFNYVDWPQKREKFEKLNTTGLADGNFSRIFIDKQDNLLLVSENKLFLTSRKSNSVSPAGKETISLIKSVGLNSNAVKNITERHPACRTTFYNSHNARP